MARPCSVCGHEARAAVDAAIASGDSQRAIAARFALHEDAVRRHTKAGHADGPAKPAKPAKHNGTDARARVAEAVPPKRHRTHAAEVERILLEAAVVDARLAGKDYRQIAAELGATPGACFAAMDRVLTRTQDYASEKADVARAIEVARCDALLAALWRRATDPNCAIVQVPADNEAGCRPYDGQDKALTGAVKIMERRAKLLGLDERVKVDVTSAGQTLGLPAGHPLASLGRAPTVEELEAFAARGALPQSEKSN